MVPTREEAGEKGRLMLLPRRHWLPSAGNNAVLFSPGSCSDQQNGLALLCLATMPNSFLPGLGYPYSPPTLPPANPITLPPPLSLPTIFLATFPAFIGP